MKMPCTSFSEMTSFLRHHVSLVFDNSKHC